MPSGSSLPLSSLHNLMGHRWGNEVSFEEHVFVLCVVLLQLSLTVLPWTVACQAPLSMEFFQARLLEWVAIFYPIHSDTAVYISGQGVNSRVSSLPRDLPHFSCLSCIDRWTLYHQHHLGSPSFVLSIF